MHMHHKFIRPVACLLLSASVSAQTPEPDVGQLETMARTDPDRILGMEVVSSGGEAMGELRGVMEDADGRLFAAIASADDEESVTTVPLESLSLGDGGLVLGAEEPQTLSQADDDGASQDLQELERPQTDPATPEANGEPEVAARLNPAEFEGKMLLDAEGQELGEIADVLEHKDDREVHLQFSTGDEGEQLVALEDVEEEEGVFVLREDAERIEFDSADYVEVQELEMPLAAE